MNFLAIPFIRRALSAREYVVAREREKNVEEEVAVISRRVALIFLFIRMQVARLG